MTPIDRRSFLKASGAVLAASATASAQDPKAAKGWRKAFMLGGVTSGAIEPHFQRLKDAGFEGVELISPNKLDPAEVVQARDKTGLVIHGVSGSRHWQDTLSSPD